ncbi:PhzF family phenazine biosynthesis protein [Nocardioides marmoriginsengisoli]|uniref:PhzF family phenazine biosynthesis protein n=1 Tax=Nocardioides marmoriginsengisoli TaxID=661483 RepID=A0A3N0CT73_9ACTN|nr:PhzF family phenazine biosynthesis protein [Nocardioides marmoriginsengisoli]RNL66196.1 PhzF family phenazine biosynthesis protein [Nocardioides marmoriginsengisoli]
MTDTVLSYDVVDVFAETPFAGNQLAVVHGAAGLTDAQLLAITREFNYSETTFPTPVGPDRYRVRIFTPGGEIPFAGHPTLGTAWVLRAQGALAGGTATQECAAGEVGIRFLDDLVELTAAPRDLVGPLEDAAVEALLAEIGLTSADQAGEAWVAGTGLSFVHLPVSEDAVTRARLGSRRLREVVALPETLDPLEGINLHAVGDGAPLPVHSRVFVPGLAGAEDPATGSAAAGLGMALVARGIPLPAGYRIRQGLEIGRPSVLTGAVEVADGTAARVRVAGQVHPVAHGEIRRPTARTP